MDGRPSAHQPDRRPLTLLRVSLGTLAAFVGLSGCATTAGVAPTLYENGLLEPTTYGFYSRPYEPERVTRTRDGERLASARPERDRRSDRIQPPTRTRPDEPARASGDASETRSSPARAEPTAAAPTRTSGGPASAESASAANPGDAAAYVHDIYAMNDTSVGDGNPPPIADIYRFARDNGTIYHSTHPAVGDLVFFHNTYDGNADGRANDWYTHIGIVEQVTEQGTVAFLSYVDGEVRRTYMNLEHPSETELDGETANSRLRAPSDGDPEWSQYLAGELFAGFGSLLGSRTEVIVVDEWHPDNRSVASAR